MRTGSAGAAGGIAMAYSRAFTILELMIACSVVAILLTLAIPGYQGHVLRSYRSAAIEALLAAAACQERIYASEFSYDTRRCVVQDDNGKYELRFEPPEMAALTGFTVLADPVEAQRGDPCGSLSLDQSGVRGISGEASRLRKCWEGR